MNTSVSQYRVASFKVQVQDRKINVNCVNNTKQIVKIITASHTKHTLSLGNGLYHGWFMKPKVG